MSETSSGPAVTDVEARPIVMARIGYACAVVTLGVFVVVALLMTRENAGAHFGVKDQIATVVVGVILGGMFLMLTRPRLHADVHGIRIRSFLGNWRTVPWDVVVRVDFPKKLRFARIVLPGEETLALYAVGRLDREQSVEVMRRLRALFALTHPDA